MNKLLVSFVAVAAMVSTNVPAMETPLPPPASLSVHLHEPVSSAVIRTKRECSMSDLNRLKVKISVALERQIEKMMKDDYIDNHTESASCTHYRGLSMNYPIRLFIRTTVENVVSDYKLELLRP